MKKRILCFFYQKQRTSLPEFIVFQLQELAKISSIHFYHAHDLRAEEKSKIESFVEEFHSSSEPFGMNSYGKALMNLHQRGLLEQTDDVVLMRDSLYGPFDPIEEIFARIETHTADVSCLWMQANDIRLMWEKEKTIKSFFALHDLILLRHRVYQDPDFFPFWQRLSKKIPSAREIPLLCKSEHVPLEEAFSNWLYTHHFSLQSLYEPIYHPLDVSEQALRGKLSFIRQSFFEEQPQIFAYLLPLLCDRSHPLFAHYTYDWNLLVENLREVLGLTAFSLIFKAQNLAKLYPRSTSQALRIALHLHVFNADHLYLITPSLHTLHHPMDFYITICEENLRKALEDYFRHQKIKAMRSLEIRTTPTNRGRDIGPFLVELKDIRERYDIIGHFHLKHGFSRTENRKISSDKRLLREGLLRDRWSHGNYHELLVEFDEIIESFQTNERLGIVLSTLPYDRIFSLYDQEMKKIMEDFIHTYDPQRTLFDDKDFAFDKETQLNYVTRPPILFPAGSMFWARCDALKNLFDLNLSYQDFPKEPLPPLCNLHAIERLFSYAAFRRGYLVQISPSLSTDAYAYHYGTAFQTEQNVTTFQTTRNTTIFQKIVDRIADIIAKKRKKFLKLVFSSKKH